MSTPTLPTKRQTAPRGMFRKMYALTKPPRKQRVAATATAEDLGGDVPGMGVSSALLIILAIHVVVIGGLFFHHRFLEGHGAIKAAAVEARQQQQQAPAPVPQLQSTAVAAPASQATEALPMIGPDDQRHIVRQGDNYERIAAFRNVDVNDLRVANNHVNLRSGMILRLPPKKIVAVPPPEMAALKAPVSPVVDADDGLVETTAVSAKAGERPTAAPLKTSVEKTTAKVETRTEPKTEPKSAPREAATVTPKKTVANRTAANQSAPPKAVPVKAKTSETKTAEVKKSTGRRSYTVKAGDNIYRIASRLNVDQKALMKANGISDPSKLRAGAQLVVPN